MSSCYTKNQPINIIMSVAQLYRFLKREPRYQANQFTIVGEPNTHARKPEIVGGFEDLLAVHEHLVSIIGGDSDAGTASTVDPQLLEMFGGAEEDEIPGYASDESGSITENGSITEGGGSSVEGGADDYWDIPDDEAAAGAVATTSAAADDLSQYLI